MANPVALPGTVVSSGAAVSPGGAQGVQGVQGTTGTQGPQGVAGESYPIGVILPYTSTTAPPTWMLCDGSAISRTTFPALFAICGVTFGAGDGSTTFNLPDLRGRVGVGAGQGASLTNRVLAATGGEETHPLTIAELASHTHTDSGHTHNVFLLNNANAGGSGANSVAGSGASTPSGTGVANLANTGSGTAHNNMEPFLVVAYIIKVSSGGGATAQAPLADSTQNGLLRQVSSLSTDYVGGDNQCHPLRAAFIGKSAAYTLTVADSGKYVICTGGSWTLTLPAPVVGLTYQVRNDMGINGTTGTITLQPTGGTIDGLASIPLLPGQECTIITDGTNWRTYGLKREVVLGTQDITSSTANGSVLLPAGYRAFELIISGLQSVTDAQTLQGRFSSDGGATWISTSVYWYQVNYNSAAGTPAAAGIASATTSLYLGTQISNVAPHSMVKFTIYPGSATTRPAVLSESETYNAAGFVVRASIGNFVASLVQINAIQYFLATGNILNSFLTVKGVV